jgi:hypothetical protein
MPLAAALKGSLVAVSRCFISWNFGRASGRMAVVKPGIATQGLVFRLTRARKEPLTGISEAHFSRLFQL